MVSIQGAQLWIYWKGQRNTWLILRGEISPLEGVRINRQQRPMLAQAEAQKRQLKHSVKHDWTTSGGNVMQPSHGRLPVSRREAGLSGWGGVGWPG